VAQPLAPLSTGLSPSMARRSRRLRLGSLRLLPLKAATDQNPTSLHDCSWRFGLGSPPFARRYLGDLILISLPLPTWMFPFGRFAFPGLAREYQGSLRNPGAKSHSGIPGSTPACGYPGLIAACRALPQPPSRVIHRLAYSGQGHLGRPLCDASNTLGAVIKAVSLFRLRHPPVDGCLHERH
jgi:hypothetical protein